MLAVRIGADGGHGNALAAVDTRAFPAVAVGDVREAGKAGAQGSQQQRRKPPGSAVSQAPHLLLMAQEYEQPGGLRCAVAEYRVIGIDFPLVVKRGFDGCWRRHCHQNHVGINRPTGDPTLPEAHVVADGPPDAADGVSMTCLSFPPVKT